MNSNASKLFNALLALNGALLFGATAFAQTNIAADKWQSVVTGHPLDLMILEPTTQASDKLLPVVVYLKNLAAPRVGMESDEPIIRDLRNAGNLVVMLDYAHQTNARVRDKIRYLEDLALCEFGACLQHIPKFITAELLFSRL